jgi:chemotaxis signal transduction protein
MSQPAATPAAARLRAAFDAMFAAPPDDAARAMRRLLLVTCSGAPCAVAMEECAGVHADVAVTALPAAVPAFAGVAAVGGAIVPVYDLAVPLGLEPRRPGRAWLLVAAGRHPIAFLVDRMDGYAEIPAGADADAPASAIVTIDGTARRLVALAPVVAAIDAAVQRLHPLRSEL